METTKKIVINKKASGSLEKEYVIPPIELLNFVRSLTDMFRFRSIALDVFEPSKGKYLINEAQCIFGQSDPYQMLVDENPGRYLFKDGQWIFEKGNFNFAISETDLMEEPAYSGGFAINF